MRIRRPAALVAVATVVSGALGAVAAQIDLSERPVIEIHETATGRFLPSEDGVVFALAVGTDYRPGVPGKRADGLHLIAMNGAARAATILNIPRDTYVSIPGRGRGRINSAHTFGGPALQAAAVEVLTGIRPGVTVVTDFAGFRGLVDGIGGVNVDIPQRHADPFSEAYFEPGRHHLDGAQALAFTRNRHLAGGDFTRTNNQGLLIIAALADLRASTTDAAGVIRLLGVLANHTVIDGMDLGELFQLGRVALQIDPASVRNITMPGTVGNVGGASVVLPGGGAASLFADIADDALVNGSAG